MQQTVAAHPFQASSITCPDPEIPQQNVSNPIYEEYVDLDELGIVKNHDKINLILQGPVEEVHSPSPSAALPVEPLSAIRSIISGVKTRTTAKELTEKLRTSGINILCARIMGETNTAIITFEGIKNQNRATALRAGAPGRAIEDYERNAHSVNYGSKHPATD
ncbi:hypothetical protein HPB47_004593 [Ixodes persulcatus]|uniref:Uncharacterized protein n=1 Tax=Ixodes persulcatus TaxID=34615 RepID=A0AC60PFJ4_IXOPE|nr:hypothetical protein HPB47_004593 [Ixodes persulcatus]